jgi:RNA polymerase sigma factor (sigma-70 family)
VRDGPTVAALVTRAMKGDHGAWDEIVERHAPLVWSICRRYRLDCPDINDVAQYVWLRLVERLAAFREPAALPGWLATTTQRECLRALGTNQFKRREERLGLDITAAEQSATIEEEIIAAEWEQRDAYGLRTIAPALPGAAIVAHARSAVAICRDQQRLEIPVGAIGSHRARCLARTRRCAPLASLFGAERDDRGGEFDV